jgi:dephospho-CoA kinase
LSGGIALWIDHIGSTSVPGLPSKDAIDIQIIVGNLDRDSIVGAMEKTISYSNFPELRERIFRLGWLTDCQQ